MKNWRVLAIALSLLLVVLVLTFCGRKAPPPAATSPGAGPGAGVGASAGDLPIPYDKLSLPPPPPAPPTQPRAAVFTDISGSMQGFTSAKAVTLGTLHHEIDLAFSALGVGNAVDRFSVGETLAQESGPAAALYQKANVYKATQSRLDLALAKPPAPPPAPNAPPPAQPADPLAAYRYALIVTDGMQASRAAPGAAAPAAGGCQEGADPYCLARLLAARVDEGYGVWFMLVMMPFSGRHFSEQSMDEGMWRRAQDHTARLSTDPFFVDANGQPVRFQVDKFQASANSSYNYVGVKPLLLIALSKDISLGRKLMDTLAAAFTRERISPLRSGGVQVMEAAPLNLPSSQIAGFQRLEQRKGKATLAVINGTPARSPQAPHPWVVNLLVNRDDDTFFALPVQTVPPPSAALSPGVEAALSLTPSNSLKGMLEATRDPQGQFGLHLRGRLVPKGKHQVILTLARSAQASKEQQVWWRRMVFSSENNYEAPDRLFGLETLVDGVCGKLLQQPAPVAQDYVVLNISRAGGAGGGCSIASSENLDQP